MATASYYVSLCLRHEYKHMVSNKVLRIMLLLGMHAVQLYLPDV